MVIFTGYLKREKIVVKNIVHQRCLVVLGCALLRFQFQLRFWDMKTLKKIQAAAIRWNNLEQQKLH